MNNKKEDFKVADLTLAEWGRKEILIAQSEMPALMKLRKQLWRKLLSLYCPQIG